MSQLEVHAPHRHGGLSHLQRAAADFGLNPLAFYAQRRVRNKAGRLHAYDHRFMNTDSFLPHLMFDLLHLEGSLRNEVKNHQLRMVHVTGLDNDGLEQMARMYNNWKDPNFRMARLLTTSPDFDPSSYLYPEGILPIVGPDNKVHAAATVVLAHPSPDTKSPLDMNHALLKGEIMTDPRKTTGTDLWFTSIIVSREASVFGLWAVFLGILDYANQYGIRAGYASALSPRWKTGMDYRQLWTAVDLKGHFKDHWHRKIATFALLGGGHDFALDDDPRAGVIDSFMEVARLDGVETIPAGLIEIFNAEISQRSRALLGRSIDGPLVFEK